MGVGARGVKYGSAADAYDELRPGGESCGDEAVSWCDCMKGHEDLSS